MRRVLAPMLGALSERGGVARYLSAIVETYPHEVKVVELSKKPGYKELFSFFWNSRKDADLYFVNHILPVGTVAWIARRKPYAIFLHSMDFDLARRNAWKRWLSKRILRGAEAIVTNSEILKGEVEEFLGAMRTRRASPVRRIFVVAPPVRDEFVEASKAVRKGVGMVDLKELLKLASGALGVPISTSTKQISRSARDDRMGRDDNNASDGFMLLTVARLVERKGHLKVLEILEHLPGVKYTIVGDGPMRERLEIETARRGLTDRVTMITNASDEDLPGIYASADIFVMPTTKTETDREGFGIVYLEANLFGLPVVATNIGGVVEAVPDGETGLLVNDELGEIESAIRKLVENPALRAKLGLRGRARVLEQFTREAQMSKLRGIIAGEGVREGNKGL